ncbi:Protein of unknown function [Bacillus mobilis]|nr:Protein of unknown function [Bacillus mobilis]
MPIIGFIDKLMSYNPDCLAKSLPKITEAGDVDAFYV